MFETHGLNHMTLFVRDLEASLKFYTDILRMKVVRHDPGDYAYLESGTTWFAIAQKPLFARHKPLTVSAWNMVVGALVLSPFLPSGIEQATVAPAEGLGAAIYLGIVPSLIAYASWAVALSRLPASRASNFLYCVPPVATLNVTISQSPISVNVLPVSTSVGLTIPSQVIATFTDAGTGSCH